MRNVVGFVRRPMNRAAPSRIPPGDDLDVLLGTFFKGEMQAPWPAFKPPVRARTLPLPANRPASPNRFAFGSRFSLVASVALLLLAAWLLSGKFTAPDGTPLPGLNPGTANRKDAVPVLPDVTPPEAVPEVKPPPGKERIRTTLEQGKDGRTGIRIDVPGSPSNK